jgi:hypothetical protein
MEPWNSVVAGYRDHPHEALMDRPFPFGFRWPIAMDLTLFVVTATIYVVFMQYVLGGGILLLAGGQGGRAWISS